jgi:hypothetical protein
MIEISLMYTIKKMAVESRSLNSDHPICSFLRGKFLITGLSNKKRNFTIRQSVQW